MKCVVTGAAGFIGSHLCEELLSRGHDVTGLDSFVPYYPSATKERNLADALARPHYRFHRLDLRHDRLDDLLADAEVVFHLAAMPGLVQSCLGDAKVRGQGEEIGSRQIHIVAKEAGIAGRAQESQFRAHVMAAGQAVLAVIAVDGGFEGSRVASLPAGYSRPGFDDYAGRLVAEHHRVHARRIPDSAFGIGVHVGAADADRLDAHLNFACPGRRDRATHELKLTLSDQLGDASPGHFDPLPGCGAFRSVSFAMCSRTAWKYTMSRRGSGMSSRSSVESSGM